VLAGPPSKPSDALSDYEQQLALMGVVDPDAAQVVADRQHTPKRPAGESTTDVWPDNDIPLAIFCSLITQWRMGSAGPVGLDYGVIDARLARRLRITEQQLDEAFDALQVMEDEALTWFDEVRDAAIAQAGATP